MNEETNGVEIARLKAALETAEKKAADAKEYWCGFWKLQNDCWMQEHDYLKALLEKRKALKGNSLSKAVERLVERLESEIEYIKEVHKYS